MVKFGRGILYVMDLDILYHFSLFMCCILFTPFCLAFEAFLVFIKCLIGVLLYPALLSVSMRWLDDIVYVQASRRAMSIIQP